MLRGIVDNPNLLLVLALQMNRVINRLKQPQTLHKRSQQRELTSGGEEHRMKDGQRLHRTSQLGGGTHGMMSHKSQTPTKHQWESKSDRCARPLSC